MSKQMTIDNFNGAIEMAIDSVVSGSEKDTDYTYSIKSALLIIQTLTKQHLIIHQQ
jgi:hypothetical protein